MDIDELRVTKLKEYLMEVIEGSNININILDKNIESYSLDKIPTETTVTKWITGDAIKRDLYSFRCRKEYSYDEIKNLENIGFYEIFEKTIKDNNKKGILPDIDDIRNIECLNCGTMTQANTGTAIFDIQIQITYLERSNL